MVFKFELVFDIPHRVITEVTGESSRKTQWALDRGHIESFSIFINESQRVFDEDMLNRLGLTAGFCTQYRTLFALDAQPFARRESDDRVAAKAFATDDGFEQVG